MKQAREQREAEVATIAQSRKEKLRELERRVLELLRELGRPSYSRELFDLLKPDGLRLHNVQAVLRELEARGVLASENVTPAQRGFKSGIMRRYYRLAAAEGAGP